MSNGWLEDIEHRGQFAFNKGIHKTHKDAEAYARRTYRAVVEQDCFVAGWNKAFWASDRSAWSTTAERYAPGNFVETWFPELGRKAVGVTRAIDNVTEANPRILVKWMHDLTTEWVRAEYLHLAN